MESEGPLEEYIRSHEQLFSASPVVLGRIHYLILEADSEMDRRREETEFSEVGLDDIHWWVFNKETNHEELRKRTELVLVSVQKLKADAFSLKDTFVSGSYSDLAGKLKEFCDSHSHELNALYEYVMWLHNTDVLAPRILFSYRVWGSTRLSDRGLMRMKNSAAQEEEMVRLCTEIALGLRTREEYTVGRIYSDMSYELAEAADPEEQTAISVPTGALLLRTKYRVLDEFATYFEFLRQSLRNIVLEIDRYNAHTNLLKRESFWRDFIVKAIEAPVENQLWDFKQSLDMWSTSGKEKEDAVVRFCEHVAAFANAKGGVLIVGVSNERPRRIVGIEDLENRMKYTKEVILTHINYDTDFTHFQAVSMKDESVDNVCLVIAVAQTKNVVSVRGMSGDLSYPLRVETGISRAMEAEIRNAKTHVYSQNYNFLVDLDNFVHDRPE